MICIISVKNIDLMQAGISQFLVQFSAVPIVGVYSFILTWLILKLLSWHGKFKIQETSAETGIDKAEYGESAYHK